MEQEEKNTLQKIKNTRSSKSEKALYVLLSAEGMKVKSIAEKLDRHEHTVRTWLKAYISHGIKALTSKSPPGRARIKGTLVEEEIEKILVKTPREFGYQEEGWTVRIIVDYLFQKKINVVEELIEKIEADKPDEIFLWRNRISGLDPMFKEDGLKSGRKKNLQSNKKSI